MYTKLKQLIAATLSVFLLGTMSPTTAFAADHTSIKPTQNDSILLNTNNSEVGIELYNSEPVTIAKYQTASAWQSGRFYLKSDNSTLGEFKTVGEFTYDGTICNVTNCKNSVWNVADGWQVKNSASEKQVSPTFARPMCPGMQIQIDRLINTAMHSRLEWDFLRSMKKNSAFFLYKEGFFRKFHR